MMVSVSFQVTITKLEDETSVIENGGHFFTF